MSLTELSIKRPTLVVVIFTVLALLGIVSYFSIGYELLPKMSALRLQRWRTPLQRK
jgi:HAE1 family hydrophobic/amphiphilic exporter-1